MSAAKPRLRRPNSMSTSPGTYGENSRASPTAATVARATGEAIITPSQHQDRAELVARELGAIEDCAKLVEFLAIDLSDYVTGAVVPIDGGLVRGWGAA